MVSTHGYVAAIPPLGAADTGGQVVYVLELSKKLAQLGYAVDIWTRRFEDQPEVDVVNERVRIVRMPCGGRGFVDKEYLIRHLPEWTENALRYIHRHQLKYLFFNSHYWDAGFATQRLAEALDVPHVHTPHSLGLWKQQLMERDFPDDAGKFETKYNFTQRINEETLLYKTCEAVIATTPVQVDMIVGDYGANAELVHMIPPGYDDNKFFPVGNASRAALRTRLGFEGKVVLALGRLARNKGYDLLVDAFSLVASRIPDARLHLAVGGMELTANEQKLLSDLHEQIETLGLGGRVSFGGFVADSDLADFYRAADVFVLYAVQNAATIALCVWLGRHSLAGLTASVSIAYTGASGIALGVLALRGVSVVASVWSVHVRRSVYASLAMGLVMTAAWSVPTSTRGAGLVLRGTLAAGLGALTYVLFVLVAQRGVEATRRKVQG